MHKVIKLDEIKILQKRVNDKKDIKSNAAVITMKISIIND